MQFRELGQENQVSGAPVDVARPAHAQAQLVRAGTVLLGPTDGPGPHQHAHAIAVPQVRDRGTRDVRPAVRRGAQQPAQQRLEQRHPGGVAVDQQQQQFLGIPVGTQVFRVDVVQRLLQHHTPPCNQRRAADGAQCDVLVATNVAHQHGVPGENQTGTEKAEESGGRVQVSPEEIGTYSQTRGQGQSAEKRERRTHVGRKQTPGTDMSIKTNCR